MFVSCIDLSCRNCIQATTSEDMEYRHYVLWCYGDLLCVYISDSTITVFSYEL
jgi:hypothetical protein